jgi:cellulose synthase (UDP-forming)
MGISKKRSISVIMVVMSLLMSTRYMYFRKRSAGAPVY